MSKHYYIYIEAGAQIDLGSRFFRVGIGTSKQANRDFLFLLGHAVSSGFYFEKQSDVTDNFLKNIAKSLNLDSTLELNVTLIDGRCLVRSIKAQTAANGNPYAAHNAEHQRLMLYADYRFMSKLRSEKRDACGNHV